LSEAAVVCPQPLVADTAAEILRGGGNAVDAVVAGMAIQGVIDPLMCGLGGYGVMTLHEAATGLSTVIDFFPRAPLGVTEGHSDDVLMREFTYDYGFIVKGGHNEIGHRSIATPGTVAGMGRALEQFGTMPWSAALEPAATLAEDGFELTEAQQLSWYSDDGPDKPGGLVRLSYSDDGRAVYTDDGMPLLVGHRVRNPDLAGTLRHLMKHGPGDFYHGELCQTMIDDLTAHGSQLRAADFAAYEVSDHTPLTTSYRDTTLAFPGFPGGGVSILAAMNLLEVLQADGVADWPSTESVATVAQALHGALEDKYTYLAGSRDVPIPVEQLISREYARRRKLADARAVDDRTRAPADSEPASTTHIAVVDREGNAASATHTLASGSGVIVPGLGFMFNNFMHGYDPRPGKWNSLRPGATRPASMSPGLVFDGTGELIGVLGASGSTRIVSALVQVVSHLLDRRWEPVRAVAAPRINVQLDGSLQCEGRLPGSVIRGIEQSGRRVRRHLRNYDPYFGKAHVLWRTGGNAPWTGAADPRGDGGAALIMTEVEALS
jgi:gamma-glutamyltranspeptidase/glutathione hydrolase